MLLLTAAILLVAGEVAVRTSSSDILGRRPVKGELHELDGMVRQSDEARLDACAGDHRLDLADFVPDHPAGVDDDHLDELGAMTSELDHEHYMRQAIELAANVPDRPFAAVIVDPRFVQNRCYASFGWDRQVREFCRAHDMVYQGFSLLTANRQTLAAGQLAQIAARHRRTIPQIVFRFAIQVGMIPLMGTTDAEHMQADLDVFDFRLQPAEIAWIEDWDVR